MLHFVFRYSSVTTPMIKMLSSEHSGEFLTMAVVSKTYLNFSLIRNKLLSFNRGADFGGDVHTGLKPRALPLGYYQIRVRYHKKKTVFDFLLIFTHFEKKCFKKFFLAQNPTFIFIQNLARTVLFEVRVINPNKKMLCFVGLNTACWGG